MTSEDQQKRRWRIPEPDPDQTIWRYMDFTQFVSILQNESLWFNKVNTFEDPFEGKIPDMNYKTIESRYKDTEIDVKSLPQITANIRSGKKITFVNCWHENDHQSAAMWDIYLSNNQGVAIQSTPDLVQEALEESDRSITVGKVEYVDYDQFIVPEINLFAPSFFKRHSFEHENEIRFAFMRIDAISAEEDTTVSNLPSGEYLSINTGKLIDEVYISPTAPDWFGELVSKVLKEYGIDTKITHSSLYEDRVK